MAAPELDLQAVAHLARLALSPQEEQTLRPQLAGILAYMEKLQALDVRNVEPTAHAIPMTNVARPDRARPSLPTEEALRNAPAQNGSLFMVPKIVE